MVRGYNATELCIYTERGGTALLFSVCCVVIRECMCTCLFTYLNVPVYLYLGHNLNKHYSTCSKYYMCPVQGLTQCFTV